MLDETEVRGALLRWIAALNAQGKRDTVGVALSAAITIHRYLPGATTPVASFSGLTAAQEWVARTPPECQFTLVEGTITTRDDAGYNRAQYQIRSGDFVNHGWWRFKLSPEARFYELHHMPDPLPE